MKKIIIIIGILIFLLIFFLILRIGCHKELAKVCIKEYCFDVELAKTKTERERGLMFKKELNEKEGMLFVFEKEGVYPFWMKNVFIPLDIIWIDKENKVVFISAESQPCRESVCPEINPGVSAQYVLEINAGLSEGLGIEVGDIVIFDI